MNDKPTPEGWLTKDQRLRALVSGSNRHSISSDTLFAVLIALESNFFYSGDGDEYNNDEVISAFKALAGELELPKTTVAIKSNEPVAWVAFATDGSESSAVYMTQEQSQAAANDWGWSIAPLYRTPHAHATQGECTSHGGCTLTQEERGAVAGIAEALRRLRVYPEQLGRTQQDDVDLLFRIAGAD